MWKRIVGPLLLMAFFWLSTSAATTVFIFWLMKSNARILDQYVKSIEVAGSMQELLWKLQTEFLDALTEPDVSEFKRQTEELDSLEREFLQNVELAQELSVISAEHAVVQEIREQFVHYRQALHQRLERQPVSPVELSETVNQTTQMAYQVSATCTRLATLNEQLMSEAVTRRESMERTFNVGRFGLLILGPGLGLWVGWRIAKNLQHSMSQISVTLKDASGDLKQEIGRFEIVPSGDTDDLGLINEQVRVVSAQIRQVLTELNIARQEAMAAERLAVVGGLAAGVAHEIRNPLTSVKLLVQTATETPQGGIELDGQQLKVVLQEILRIEETIQGLLDFARPPVLRTLEHDLRSTVQRALNLVEGRARFHQVALRARFPDSPVTINGDPELLHQVFSNLLINGIDAMRNGGILEVVAEPADSAGRVKVTVSDSGEGIAPDRLESIFDPFVTTKTRGIGLGLAVTRRIVHEHGGTITAANRPTGGAIFTVELSASQRLVAAPSESSISTRSVSSEPAHAETDRSRKELTDAKVACH
ncbi:MAG: hypothetical protein JSS02_04140 [Planctomycetes bacterium]|nr:hypothetical protein [Planctomycetota bacterium]